VSFTVRYPHIHVRLTGTDGNAFSILGKVQRELRRAGVPQEEIRAFTEEATRGDFNHLMATAMHTVEVS